MNIIIYKKELDNLKVFKHLKKTSFFLIVEYNLMSEIFASLSPLAKNIYVLRE